jgi:23S rRNA (cytosine1962-C5)-methyltransferase
MLHAFRLGIPSLDRTFETSIPTLFSDWVHGKPPSLGRADDFLRRLRDAGTLRYPLFARSSAFRLANDLGDVLPGVTIDRYGDFAVLSVSTPEAIERKDEIASALIELGARGVHLKVRERADQRRVETVLACPPAAVAGDTAPDELEVDEDGLRFLVRLGDGLSTGLFVDQRENRALVRSLSKRKRVLNLFSYTGSFSVAAAAGEARQVVSVDLSAPSLERERRNFALNRLDPEMATRVKADVIDWLRRAKKRGERFDIVVLDPPSFGTRGRRSTFDVASGYAELAADALSVLEPGGRLLAVTNHRKTSRERLRRLLHEAGRTSGRAFEQMKDLASSLDCPEGPEGPVSMKSVLVTVR